MTGTWNTRPVRPQDAALVAIHRYAGAGTAQDLRAYEHWVVSALARGSYVGLLAEREGEVIAGAGAVLLEWGPSRGDPSAWRARIVNVFTVPAWRRRGIARHLVRGVMARCRQSEVRVFNLATSDEGRSLYRSLGFEPYPAEMVLRCSEQRIVTSPA